MEELQIVVNDEIIDLRNHEFEDEPQPFRKILTNSKSRSKSSNFNPEEQRQTVNGLKKLASTLYNGPSTPLLQKHRNIIRSRQKVRAFSIDPRFRKDRSPAMDNNLCKSESNVGENSDKKNNSIKTSQSMNSISKECCPYSYPDRGGDASNEMAQDSKIPQAVKLYKKKDLLKNKKKYDQCKLESAYFPEEEPVCECEKFHPVRSRKKLVEQATMTDEVQDMLDFKTEFEVPTKSCYESAISAMVTNQEVCTCLAMPIVNSEMKISKDISPYWHDQRLMEKYANLIKPINLKSTRSSWTLPFSNNKKMLEANDDSSLVFGYSSNVLNTYKYDNLTDIDEGSITFESAKNKLMEALLKNYYFTPFFLLGSVCGLALVGLLGWMLASDFLWTYFYPVKKEEKWYTVWFNYFAGGIIHVLESIFRSISYILLMPRHEIFNRHLEQG